ncbi:DUF1971 domain-containing protein [Sphingomonas sp. IC4-52]|uniref:DUF1971 domain-containing protein n=1 Tax=Sphingomonas sp. IC4-52 TaxID=2887202 RepID=UPI001D12A28F|nr:DUF1971 domain-containing protein [Sphingomonas sp. IC4-52]MCC2981068.1 DUF1971 domain-containing protein [Sphingomonas sp. IC4-52]
MSADEPSAPRANPARLPNGLEPYRRTPVFTEETVPAALLRDHDTKAGTWGLIHVLSGQLRYRITDPRRAPAETLLTPDTPPGVVEPTIVHHVEPVGAVTFQVEFLRAAPAPLCRYEELAQRENQLRAAQDKD